MRRSVLLLLAIAGVVYVQTGDPRSKKDARAGSESAAAAPAGAGAAEPGCAALVASALDEKDHPAARTIVLTVPDPIDGRLDFEFDLQLAAFQSAAGVAGWRLESFWLPWQEERRSPAGALARERCHAKAPGVLAFRGNGTGTSGGAERLVVFVVGEVPTSGIQQTALGYAIEHAVEVRGAELAILGPTFSGSARSIREVLARFPARGFRLVTGSATAGDELRRLNGGTPIAAPASVSRLTSVDAASATDTAPERRSAPAVRVQSTVHDDGALRAVMTRFLRERHVEPWRTAFLVESGTGYGEAAREALTAGDAPAYLVPFPLHVSRIRTAFDRGADAPPVYTVAGVEVSSPMLGLRREAGEEPRDVIPALGRSTDNYEELALASSLSMLARHGIQAIGVLATDARDKRFLVRKIREFCPGVLVFTYESDLLFAYPDEQDALRGVLIASTYPLFVETQSWTGPDASVRLQFPDSAAQGGYNAALAVLHPDPALRFVDYRCPSPTARTSRPPVWISVVGTDALWPVAVDCDAGATEGAPARPPIVATAATTVADRPPPRAASAPATRWFREPHASVGFKLFGVLIALVASWTAMAVLRPRPRSRDPLVGVLASPSQPSALHAGLRWGYLAALAMGALGFAVAMAVPSAVSWRELRHVEWSSWLLTGVGLAGAYLPVRALLGRSRTRLHGAALGIAAALAALAVVGTAAWMIAGALDLRLTFYRATNVRSGVSPVLPLAMLWGAALVYLRERLRRSQLLDAPLVAAIRARGIAAGVLEPTNPGRLSALEARLLATLEKGVPAVERGADAICLLLVAAIGLRTWVPSIEGRLFDVVYLAAFLMVLTSGARTWVRLVAVWRAASAWLAELGLHPAHPGFGAVAVLFGAERIQRLFVLLPARSHLDLLATLAERVGRARPDAAAPELVAALRGAVTGSEPALVSSAFRAASDRAARWAELLRSEWAGAPERAKDAPGSFRAAAEAFVCARTLLALSWVAAQVRGLVIAGATGAMALLLSLGVYAFPSYRALMLVVWAVILSFAGTSVWMLVRADRDIVVSLATGTTPGRITLDRDFVTRAATLVGAPLFLLLAVQFPVIGRTLATWIDPVLRTIK